MTRIVSLASLAALIFLSNQILAEEATPQAPTPLAAEHADCVVGDLLAELSSESVISRRQAARSLGRLDLHHYPSIEPALASALTSDPAKSVRLAAARSLAKLGAASHCTAEAYALAMHDPCLVIRGVVHKARNETPGFGPCPGPGCLGTGHRGHSTHLQPFVVGDTLYEPRLRDMRELTPSKMLPGNDAGIPETLPVLPPRKYGFFMLRY